jgi:rsbT co-antagonist protein RsbR
MEEHVMSHKPTAPETRGPSRKQGISDDLLRMMVESVKDYAIITLDLSGNVSSWNPGAERLKGYRAQEIIGKHFSCFYPAEEVQRGQTEHELKVAAAEGRFEDEGSWRVRKDGSRFIANVVITALRDQNGELMGFGKITRDITERKLAEEKIFKQAKEILEMSTPVVKIWEGVIVVPLIGTLDTERAQRLTEHLLHRIMETGSLVALLDITGVPTIDTKSAQHIIETIAAVRLLGAEVVLTGIRPAIAQTLVHLGIDLASVTTRPSLAAGLRYALEGLNLEVTTKNPQP